jgi:hypothetical protein
MPEPAIRLGDLAHGQRLVGGLLGERTAVRLGDRHRLQTPAIVTALRPWFDVSHGLPRLPATLVRLSRTVLGRNQTRLRGSAVKAG